jgi:hypothetical protein
MRISLFVVGCLVGLAEAAQASPVTLICNGSMTADGNQIPINGQTAILDVQNNSFKPPMYTEHPLIRVEENLISFGFESEKYSTEGSLDRVSGSFAMTVMKPDERKKLKAGGTAHFMTWMSGKCVPAQRMF